jgi:peroxiredoxin/mono/diheme cytochrome c family protein
MRSKLFAPLVAVLALIGAATAGKVETPIPQPAAYAGVGRMAPDLTAKTVAGTEFKLSAALKDHKAAVIAVTSSSCPLSKKYLPALTALEKEFGDKVAFVLLAPISTDTPAELKEAVGKTGIKAPVIHDADGKLSAALGAATTTDLFVLDAKRTVVYRGAVDDQYGLGYSKEAATHTYAKDALTAVLAGQEPKVPATTAPGCALDLPKAEAAAKPTYHREVARIVQWNCQECHRKGGVGPFALDTRADMIGHKGMIKKVLADATMPPWHAVGPKAGEPRTFKNDRSLPDADRDALLAWLADGAPEGDPADAPLPRTYPDDWAIGKPDLVVQVPEPIAVKATGVMKYQNVLVETGLTEDRWMRAAEIRPTDASVVHHVLVFVIPPHLRLVPKAGEGQGFFAAYVPGNGHQILPDGFARKIPKGSLIKFQIHYTPNGTATKDQVRVGFKFADNPRYEIRVLPVAQPKIEIPPGADNHKEVAEFTLPVEGTVTAVSPHMHVRGKACKYEAVLPDGETKVLLDVPHYDFNWQHRYQFAAPVTLPKGTIVRFTVWYDNSDKNPANPDPKETVRWGPQTFQEMHLGYTEFYIPALPLKAEKK